MLSSPVSPFRQNSDDKARVVNYLMNERIRPLKLSTGSNHTLTFYPRLILFTKLNNLTFQYSFLGKLSYFQFEFI